MSETTRPSAFRGFSLKETAVIRKQIVTRGARLLCPRCGGTLTLNMGEAGSPQASWELRCEPCQRKLLVPRPRVPMDPMATP